MGPPGVASSLPVVRPLYWRDGLLGAKWVEPVDRLAAALIVDLDQA
jgi:hypothetical protein